MNPHVPSTASITPVLIVGAGPAGAVLACLCAHGGLPVDLLSEFPDPARRADWVLAISPASVRLLQRARIWEHIPQAGRAPYHAVEVWDETGGLLRFDRDELRCPAPGWMVQGDALYAGLEAALAEAPGLRRRSLRVNGLAQEAGRISLKFEDAPQRCARLVVAADGVHSTLRRLAGIGLRERDYRQQALTCKLRHVRPHGAVSRQKFLAGGPLALLPTADPHQCGLVWTLPEQEAPQVANLSAACFHSLLEEHSEGVLGAMEALSPRSLHPLRRVTAETYFQGRLVLLGDAAHLVHPLAGLGANLGLADAALLAALLLEAHRRQRDPGDAALLARYQRRRRLENACFVAGLDTIGHAFRLPRPWSLARRAVLGWLNDHPAAKALLAAPALEVRAWPPAADLPVGIASADAAPAESPAGTPGGIL